MNNEDAIVVPVPINGRAAAPYSVPKTAIATAAGALVARIVLMPAQRETFIR
jgi:hypothetical protein